MSASAAAVDSSHDHVARDLRGLKRLIQVARGSQEDIIISSVAWFVLIALIVALGILQPSTFTINQFSAYAGLSVVFSILAFGQMLVLLTGGVDLSLGGALSVTNVLTVAIIGSAGSAPLVGLAIIGIGAVMGLINGTVIVYGRMQPLIVTLAMWFVWAGVAMIIQQAPGGSVPVSLASIISGHVVGIPNPFWILALLGLVGTWILRTRFGLSLRAIGSDPLGAVQSGIAINRTLLLGYMLSGAVVGLGGFILACQNSSGDPTTGANYLLPVITAAVVGGTSLLGGRGGPVGGIVGSMILTYVASIAFAANVPSQWSTVLDGVILIGAVAAQYGIRRALERRAAR